MQELAQSRLAVRHRMSASQLMSSAPSPRNMHHHFHGDRKITLVPLVNGRDQDG
jgi:hypothetical protein